MIDVSKIDDAIKYLDFEPKKKCGEYRWLVALLVSPYILGLIVLLVGTALQGEILK